VSHEYLFRLLNEIEEEMNSLGLCVRAQGAPQQVTSAFGGTQMPFEHWLVLVFLPSARKAIF
jgi:hypothetical protein